MSKTHSLNDWAVIIGGVPVGGFATDDAFSFEPNSADAYELLVGADGEAVRSKIINDAGRLTLHILDVSASQDVLQAAKLLDELTGFGQFPVMVKHLKSATKLVAAQAWIANNPTLEIGKTAGSRDWAIDSGSWKVSFGGILVPV